MKRNTTLKHNLLTMEPLYFRLFFLKDSIIFYTKNMAAAK